MTATGDTNTGSGDPSAAGGSPPGAAGLGALVVVLALVGAGLVAATAGTAGASAPTVLAQSSGDSGAPTLGNLTKVDATTVDLEIKDSNGVNASTINASDFELSAGALSGVTTGTNGSDTVVTLGLDGPIDDDQLHVTIAENGTIEDDAGNELRADDTIGRRVYEMDGQAPTISGFRVADGSGNVVHVAFEASESLSSVTVDLTGPASAQMDAGDFSSPAGFHEYEGTITPPASGEYRVTVSSVTDRAGNTRELSVNETVRVDVTPPAARARIDYGNSDGLAVTFDASHSTDDELLKSYDWSLGDGTNATGEAVSHEYQPGNYTVTLTATDAAGNTDTDRLELNLTADEITATRAATTAGADRVTISGGGTANATAMITVDGATAGKRVTVSRDVGDGTPIVETGSLELAELSVALAENASYGLGVQADGPEAVADVTAATDGEPLGALTVVHDVADDRIENVTFSVALDRERVDEATDDPDAVRLFRYHGGEWQRLDTHRHNGTNETYRYRGTSPGLSRFALATVPALANESSQSSGPTETGTPSEATAATTDRGPITVTNATLNASTVDQGQPVRVTATVTSDGDAAAYTAGLTVDGEVTGTKPVQVPANSSIAVTFTHVPGDGGQYAVAVNDSTAGTLTVRGESLLGFLGVLPLGLFQVLVTYVGGLLVATYLLLKAVALYLGY